MFMDHLSDHAILMRFAHSTVFLEDWRKVDFNWGSVHDEMPLPVPFIERRLISRFKQMFGVPFHRHRS
jgi:hypothetical protein